MGRCWRKVRLAGTAWRPLEHKTRGRQGKSSCEGKFSRIGRRRRRIRPPPGLHTPPRPQRTRPGHLRRPVAGRRAALSGKQVAIAAPTGVDPVSWTPEHLRSRGPACRNRDDVMHLNFVARWSNWCKPDARRRRWRATRVQLLDLTLASFHGILTGARIDRALAPRDPGAAASRRRAGSDVPVEIKPLIVWWAM